jgi:CubicO group peptidase (beta-lactamase class C family)
MKNVLILINLVIFFQLNLLAQNSESKPPLDLEVASANADELLEDCITIGEMAGVVAGFSQHGETLWKGSNGYANIESKEAANIDMVHRIASISKPMTAIAILQLFEQGKLDLDDPVSKHLDYFPKHKKAVITVRHLLNHASGMKAYKNSKEAFPTTNYPTLKEAIAVFQDRKLAFEPGTSYAYTTYGYVVLGAVIEKVSGKSYRNYMKENIWIPAGMPNTDVEVYGKTYANKASLYKLTEAWTIEADEQTNLSVKVPGGGLQSTVSDLLNFGQAILDYKLIKASTFDIMVTSSGLKKQGNPYGLGWFIYGDENHRSGRIIGHSGSQSGTSTQLMIFLDRKAVQVIISNTSGAYGRLMGLFDRLAGNFLNWTKFKKSTARTFAKVMQKEGFDSAMQWMNKVTNDPSYNFQENEINELGYFLINKKKPEQALEIFKANVNAFPESWNAYDSLGEIYLSLGDKDNAKINYQKSVALNPLSKTGNKALKKL